MRADSDPPAGRILVVDDHAPFRQSLQRLLEYSGFEVTTAENGLRGLLATTQSEFDLILLDVNMPGLDGFDVCAAIKASPQCAATPVVFVSASDDANAIGTAREVGASWHLSKQAMPRDIVDCIRLHATRRVAHDPALHAVETGEVVWRHQPDEEVESAMDACDMACVP